MEKESQAFTTKENYHQILDAISDMILVKGPQSHLIWANKAFCKHYGMSIKQLRGIIDAPFSDPDYTQQYVKDDSYVFNTGNTLNIPAEPVKRHDGEVRIFNTVKSPIRDGDGKVIMTVGVSRDITDELKIKTDLEIERAKASYAAKMATLGEMAGGVAHEINTPLTVIQLAARQIQILCVGEKLDGEQITSFASRIQNTVTRIAKIVSGLRTFSRDISNEPYRAVNVVQLVDETTALCRERLASHGFKLEVHHQDPEHMINCVQVQISQVLLNLINNAFDATQNFDEKWIRIETGCVGDVFEIRVTDSGHGIPKELEEKMFDPFFTTKELGKGTGLGLSIAKGIMQAHQGTISINRNSKNTQFVITFSKTQKKRTHEDHSSCR